MQIRFVDADGAHLREPDDIVELFAHDDGFFWIDIPEWDDRAEGVFRGLGCHSRVVEACRRENRVPTLHTYEDHSFVTTQSPLAGEAGRVHHLELDQVVAAQYLITVHGPVEPGLDRRHALAETTAVLRRLEEGRFRPTTPAQLSHAITSAVARRQREQVGLVAEKLPTLEKRVMESQLTDPEELLETLFLIRHELTTVRTMAAQCHDIWLRMSRLGRLPGDADAAYSGDLADQFDRVRSIADGEATLLFGVIELYQTKVHTKMTVAMERLAVIAAVTLPITAIASVYGMNVIVNQSTHWAQLVVLVVVMLVISGTLLRWARKQGWW